MRLCTAPAAFGVVALLSSLLLLVLLLLRVLSDMRRSALPRRNGSRASSRAFWIGDFACSCFSRFFRDWNSPLRHIWQNGQSSPFLQPLGIQCQTHGLHCPVPCRAAPAEWAGALVGALAAWQMCSALSTLRLALDRSRLLILCAVLCLLVEGGVDGAARGRLGVVGAGDLDLS